MSKVMFDQAACDFAIVFDTATVIITVIIAIIILLSPRVVRHSLSIGI